MQYQGRSGTPDILYWQGLERRTTTRLVSAVVLTAGYGAGLLRDVGVNHVSSTGDCQSL